jgi:hypothetical protein
MWPPLRRAGGILGLTLLTRAAWADHGSAPTPASGGASIWLVAGGVVALLLAVAWALFGPGARDPESGTPDARGSDGSRPPD